MRTANQHSIIDTFRVGVGENPESRETKDKRKEKKCDRSRPSTNHPSLYVSKYMKAKSKKPPSGKIIV